MIFINSESKVNSRLLSVINGSRPANLFAKHSSILCHCRTISGNLDQRVKPGDDDRAVQYGRSMIEMLGVLAIIGVLSVGGIAGYSKAMTKFKTNKVAEQVATIVTNIKTLYAQQKSYEGLDGKSAAAMGAIPDEMGSSYYLTNPFNGNVNIFSSSSTDSASDDKAFVIYYENLPKEACVDLITNDWGGQSSGLIAVGAVGTSGGSALFIGLDSQYIGCSGDSSSVMMYAKKGLIACPNGADVSAPLSPSYASQACQCDNGNTCSVGWKYY